jgi:hypothetical protein
MDVITIILNVAVPVFTGVIGWFAGGKKRRNDFLGNLQSSINMLSDTKDYFS